MSAEISKKNIDRLEDKDAFIKSRVDEILKSERVLSSWKKKLVKYNELYKMLQNQKHYEGLARIFVPEILRAVETVAGNLFKVIFGQMPWFEFEARQEQDEASAHCLTELTEYQMEENSFRIRTLDSLRQMAICGLTVRKILWDFSQVRQRSKTANLSKSVDPITGKVKVNRDVSTGTNLNTIKDHWTFEPVDLLGFHISDVTTPYHDIQKAKWIAEQYLVDKQWIRERNKKDWLCDEDFKEIEETSAYSTSDAERYRNNRKQSANYSTAGYETKKAVEIIERWGLIKAKYIYDSKELKENDLDEDEMVEAVVIIANRKFLLKLEANPFWHNKKPYVSCPYVAQDNEFSGMGVAQIGENLQEELNDTRNQLMDNKTLILMNMWLKSRSSGIKNQDLRVRPLGVIQTNDMNGLKPLAPPVLSGVGVNIEGVIKNDLRESVGASSNLQGISQGGNSTATESQIVNREAFGRLFLVAQQYAELVLKPTLDFSEFLNYQFYDTEKVVKVIGAPGIKFKKIGPDDIVGDKHVIVRLATDIDDNPGIRRQQLMQFLATVQQMPPQLIQFHWYLLDKIYKSFFPNANGLEDLYQPPPQAEQLLEPNEEFELMRNEVPTKVHMGDDDKGHIQTHEQDLEMTKFALSPLAFKLNSDHILNHYKQLAQKVQMQAQQAMDGAMDNAQGSGGGNPGQTPDATKNTQRQITKPGQLERNLGGQ